jgi:hypothetical protein
MINYHAYAYIGEKRGILMGVIASLAVFCVISKAPEIMVVSSCVNSPPFPA